MNKVEAQLANVPEQKIWEASLSKRELPELQSLIKNGSMMVTMKGNGIRHAVIVDGLDAGGEVIVRDPWGGLRYTMEVDKFRSSWEGWYIRKIAP